MMDMATAVNVNSRHVSHIHELDTANTAAWDAHVAAAPHGLPQHLAGWQQVMTAVYGYETHYLYATESDHIVGVMPLFLVRSALLGHRATTMPGGICAETPAIAAALIQRAAQIARRAGVQRLVLQDTRQQYTLPTLTTTHKHEHWVVDLRPGTEFLWGQLHSETRRQVRKGRNNGLRVVMDTTSALLDDFYHVLSHFTHQVGTPVYGRNFLKLVISTFPDGYHIAIVYKNGQPVGGYFQLILGDTLYGAWGATLRPFLRDKAAYLAYWELLAAATAAGFHFFDMGRSPQGSGASDFKSIWGGTSHPVYQQFIRLQPTGVNQAVPPYITPDVVVQNDAKMRLFMRIWPCLPFVLTQYVGPRLRRHVPFA